MHLLISPNQTVQLKIENRLLSFKQNNLQFVRSFLSQAVSLLIIWICRSDERTASFVQQQLWVYCCSLFLTGRPTTSRISKIGFCLQRQLHCHSYTHGFWWLCDLPMCMKESMKLFGLNQIAWDVWHPPHYAVEIRRQWARASSWWHWSFGWFWGTEVFVLGRTIRCHQGGYQPQCPHPTSASAPLGLFPQNRGLIFRRQQRMKSIVFSQNT